MSSQHLHQLGHTICPQTRVSEGWQLAVSCQAGQPPIRDPKHTVLASRLLPGEWQNSTKAARIGYHGALPNALLVWSVNNIVKIVNKVLTIFSHPGVCQVGEFYLVPYLNPPQLCAGATLISMIILSTVLLKRHVSSCSLQT